MNELRQAEQWLFSLYSELNTLKNDDIEEQDYLMDQIERAEDEVQYLKTQNSRIIEQIEILWMDNPNG